MSGPMAEARIVVGMPVYNAQATLADAIASILTHRNDDLRLLISDNASTDDTWRICRQFAQRDPRVTAVRQDRNVGAEANFAYVLAGAKCRYFMWAAADDIRSPDFIALCADFLDRNPGHVGATCPVKFNGRTFDEVAMGDASLEDEDRFERMLGFFGKIHANGRFYSLFRHEAIAKWLFDDKHYLGADWALVLRMLNEGKMKRLDSGWLELGAAGASNKSTIFAHYRKRFLHWPLPFLDLSRYAMNEFSAATRSQRVRLLARLAAINFIAAIMQGRYELMPWSRKRNVPDDVAPPHGPPGPIA